MTYRAYLVTYFLVNVLSCLGATFKPVVAPLGTSSRVARRLAVVHQVQPGLDTVQTALSTANTGDILELANGVYTGSGDNVLEISKDITIRAQNSGQAVLDGENARRVVVINDGAANLEGLVITKGSFSNVRANPRHHLSLPWSRF